MRKTLATALILPVLAVPFFGCGDKVAVPTPPSCLTAPTVWLTALASAPDQVALEKVTPISDCLPENQSAAQQQEVGHTVVEVASILARASAGGVKGEASVGGQAALEAGYLVGALEKAARGSGGIHATLVERVKAAATNGLDEAGPALQAAYREGHKAGLESG